MDCLSWVMKPHSGGLRAEHWNHLERFQQSPAATGNPGTGQGWHRQLGGQYLPEKQQTMGLWEETLQPCTLTPSLTTLDRQEA
jgi:hypothetical protein